MADEQDVDGSRDDLALAVDIDDWIFAGRHLLRAVELLGRCVPPLGPGPAAELSWRITKVDDELGRLFDTWETLIRPRLKRHEGNEPPALTFL